MPTRTTTRQPKRDGERSRTATLQDIAQVAGVTPMTVSRVIKGGEGVGAATRERVLRIAEEFNYTANLSARALATGKTGFIAIISGNVNQYYYANMVHLLESQLTSSGYEMRLLNTRSDLKTLISSTNAAAVDGIIIAGRYHLAEEFRALAPQVFQSCVFIDASKHDETDYVHADLRPAVEEALELMLQAGRTRIAYVGHFSQNSCPALSEEPVVVPEERLRTYLSVMEQEGRPAELFGTSSSSFTPDNLKQYIQEHGTPDAMLCVNDETAMYTDRTLRDAGLRVPGDVLLVGCDGFPFMECFDPPLSTIVQPMEEMCDLAWKFLQMRIANPNAPLQQATLNAQLLVRASLG